MKHPRIRPLEAFPVRTPQGQMICLRDSQNFASKMVFLPQDLFYLVSLMDGKSSILDLQAAYMRRFGQLIYSENIEELVKELDSYLLLDSEMFAAHKKGLCDEFKALGSRQAAHAGLSYEAEPGKLKAQLDGFFDPPAGPGPVGAKRGAADLKAVIAPHIDLRHGGPCYAHAYKEVAERSDPEVVVILGTCHSEMANPFALCAKDFETPLGTVEADKEITERIASASPFDPFLDEFSHKSEHTVEFQTIFLKHCLKREAGFMIVPVLCGSPHQFLLDGREPCEDPLIEGFLGALKSALEASGTRHLYAASVDLSHIGLRYGDAVAPDRNALRSIADADLKMLSCVQNLDAAGFFKSVASDGDKRRICGLAAIYALLKLVDAQECRLLKYDQLFDREGGYMVSYASMALR